MQQAHDILGISPDASFADIKAVYRKLVKANHPDLAEDPAKANQALKVINAAYSELTSGSPAAERARSAARTSARPTHEQEPSTVHPRSSSPFGFKQRREEERSEHQAQMDRERQANAWTQGERDMAERYRRGKDDMYVARQARDAAGGGETSEDRAATRAAELRALRKRRQERNQDIPLYDSHAEQARQAERDSLSRRAQETHAQGKATSNSPLQGVSISAFSQQGKPEITTNNAQDAALEAALTSARRCAARDRVAGETETVGLHKAQKVTFENRTMKVHLGSRAQVGRNTIALPDFHQSGDTVRLGKQARLMSINLGKEGGQTLSMRDASKLVKGAQNMRVQFVFSDSPENLRNKARDRQVDAR